MRSAETPGFPPTPELRPGLRTTNSRGRSCHFGCFTPMTAAAATAGWPMAIFSKSIELIHSPPVLIRSLTRSLICIMPSSIDGGDIAGGKPAIPQRRCFALVVAAHDPLARAPSVRPATVPSRGSVAPSSSTTLISMPNTDLPQLARPSAVAPAATAVAPSQAAHGCHRRRLGHPPALAHLDAVAVVEFGDQGEGHGRSARHALACRLENRRSYCSTYCSNPSQTVGTPALTVTCSSSINS